MELNWSTFFLEAINFLVLVWILKRFLYRPVLNVLDRRRSAIEQSLAEARATREQALELQHQYEHRLADWQQEKAEAHHALERELETERQRQLEALQKTLDQERRKSQTIAQRQLEEQQRHAEVTALRHGAHFTGQLLRRLADSHLEERLAAAVLEDLTSIPAERLRTQYAQDNEVPYPIQVASAYPLAEAWQKRLRETISQVLQGHQLTFSFVQAPELLAGLRITIGPWIVRANLQDELQFFTEAAYGSE